MNMTSRPGRRAAAWVLGAAAGSALTLLALSLSGGRGDRAAASFQSWIPVARADVGKGDYLFLPNRMQMWVVNRTNGKLIHYKFLDNQVGTVERSRIARINTDFFPLKDTEFLLSDRNFTAVLWVVNRATGDFQVWRSNQDGSLTTDDYLVPAGEDLLGEPAKNTIMNERPRRPSRPAAGSDESAPDAGARPETGGRKRASSSDAKKD
jgi:hypothetical protein